jgi:hypothetical protein
VQQEALVLQYAGSRDNFDIITSAGALEVCDILFSCAAHLVRSLAALALRLSRHFEQAPGGACRLAPAGAALDGWTAARPGTRTLYSSQATA